MDTPICDFAGRYAESNSLRLHMPGHKGIGPLGAEQLDITEISGADSLYDATGIIAKSEANASALFGCPTFYSTEGSSLCIRAMLYLCLLQAKKEGRKPLIAAGRNAHKVLLSAVSLLDIDVTWLLPEDKGGYLSCKITPEGLDRTLSAIEEKPVAVYVTSPDYLGNVADIAGLAAVAHRHGCLLAVDNAHGAYLRFLHPSAHPMDLGADLCCDSAHKTLPVLTGGAYLHTTASLSANAKHGLALFGSTSPSYLILQSLDLANKTLSGDYADRLTQIIHVAASCKEELSASGYRFVGDEPAKLTIDAKAYGYHGTELAQLLRQSGIECEFADPDYLVMMITPETGADGLKRLTQALLAIPKRTPITEQAPAFCMPKRTLSIREAMLSPFETIPAEFSNGRILAAASVGCPPAVPVLVSGEQIDDQIIRLFRYYSIETCCVVTE